LFDGRIECVHVDVDYFASGGFDHERRFSSVLP